MLLKCNILLAGRLVDIALSKNLTFINSSKMFMCIQAHCNIPWYSSSTIYFISTFSGCFVRNDKINNYIKTHRLTNLCLLHRARYYIADRPWHPEGDVVRYGERLGHGPLLQTATNGALSPNVHSYDVIWHLGIRLSLSHWTGQKFLYW